MKSPEYKNAVLFVKDVAKSKAFYMDVLGQEIAEDFNRYVGFKSGFGIWDASYALELIRNKKDDRSSCGSDNFELYFETERLDDMIQHLEDHNVPFIHPMIEHDWGQRGVRIEDPDGHVIEIGEPMEAVIRRLHGKGLDLESLSKKTQFSHDTIQRILSK